MSLPRQEHPLTTLRHQLNQLRTIGASEHERYLKLTVARLRNVNDDGTLSFLSTLSSAIAAMISRPESIEAYTIAKNVLSLAAIPNEYITPLERAIYINNGLQQYYLLRFLIIFAWRSL